MMQANGIPMFVLDGTAVYHAEKNIPKDYEKLRRRQFEGQPEIPGKVETSGNNPSGERHVKAESDMTERTSGETSPVQTCGDSTRGQVQTAGAVCRPLTMDLPVQVEEDPQEDSSPHKRRREEQVNGSECDPKEITRRDTRDGVPEHAQPIVGSESVVGSDPHTKKDEWKIEGSGAGYEPPTEVVDRGETSKSGLTTPINQHTCGMEADKELSGDDVISKPKRQVQSNRKKHKKPGNRMRKRGRIPVEVVQSDSEYDDHRDVKQQEAMPKTKRIRLKNKRDTTLELYVSTSTSSQSADDPE